MIILRTQRKVSLPSVKLKHPSWLLGLILLSVKSDLKNGTFRNPVLPQDLWLKIVVQRGPVLLNFVE